jgi:hypothetical protein
LYSNAIENLQPGITQIAAHLAYDAEEMQAITIDHPDHDAAWRQSDSDFFTSKRAQELLGKMTFTWLTGTKLAGPAALMRLVVAYWLGSLSVLSWRGSVAVV